MYKNFALAVLLSVLVTFMYFHRVSQAEKVALQNKIQSLQEALEQEKKSKNDLAQKIQQEEQSLARQEKTQKKMQDQELDDRRRAYSDAKSAFETAKKTLDDLKNRKNNDDLVSLRRRISDNTDLVKRLEDRIKDFKSQDNTATKEGLASLRAQKNQLKSERGSLKQQIHQLQEMIKNDQKQASYWRKQNRDFNQPNKLQELNTHMEQLNGEIQELRAQDLSINEKERLSEAQIKRSLNEGKSNSEDSQKTNTAYAELIRKAQQNYNFQFNLMKTAEEALNKKQKELETQ